VANRNPAGGEVSEQDWSWTQDRKVVADEQDQSRAIWPLAEHDRWRVEGTAGVATAGPVRLTDEHKSKKVALVLRDRKITPCNPVATFSGTMACA